MPPLAELWSFTGRSTITSAVPEGSVSKSSHGEPRLKGIEVFATETFGIQSFVDDPFRKMSYPGASMGKVELIAPA